MVIMGMEVPIRNDDQFMAATPASQKEAMATKRRQNHGNRGLGGPILE